MCLLASPGNCKCGSSRPRRWLSLFMIFSTRLSLSLSLLSTLKSPLLSRSALLHVSSLHPPLLVAALCTSVQNLSPGFCACFLFRSRSCPSRCCRCTSSKMISRSVITTLKYALSQCPSRKSSPSTLFIPLGSSSPPASWKLSSQISFAGSRDAISTCATRMITPLFRAWIALATFLNLSSACPPHPSPSASWTSTQSSLPPAFSSPRLPCRKTPCGCSKTFRLQKIFPWHGGFVLFDGSKSQNTQVRWF